MPQQISIRISDYTKDGWANPVGVNKGMTLGEILKIHAPLALENHVVTVNNRPVGLSDTPDDGDTITITPTNMKAS